MMNQYKLGPVVSVCEITIEFFKTVAERNLSAKKKSDLAIKSYRQNSFRTAALLFLELAEEGQEVDIL